MVVLRDAIDRCREGALLKPVTIIVPSVAMGMPALQELARLAGGAAQTGRGEQTGGADGTGGAERNNTGVQTRGVFGVRHWTVAGLAEHILNFCEPARRRPRNNRVVAAALRQIGNFGVFEQVRHHEATEQVLVSTLKELERLSSEDLESLGDLPSQRARDLLQLELGVREELSDKWLSNSQMMQRAFGVASESLELPSSDNRLLLELGSVIVFLPQRLSKAESELLRLCRPEAVIVALTGAPEADRAVHRSAKLLDSSFADLPNASSSPPLSPPASHFSPSTSLDSYTSHSTAIPPHSATTTNPSQTDNPTLMPFVPSAGNVAVVSAPTVEGEIRLAVRSAMEALREGMVADRLAIAFTSRDLYARILVDCLSEAGISFSIAGGFPLRERVVPKAVLAMLHLEASDYSRSDLINLLASSPIMVANKSSGEDGQKVRREPAPVAAWDRVSRKAKVARGQWELCLQRFIKLQEKEINRKTDDSDLDERRASYANREIYYAESLLRFVKRLKEDVKKVALAETWHDKAKEVRTLVNRYLQAAETNTGETDPGETSAWNDDEERAKEDLFKILARLEALDEIESAPSHSSFMQALAQELEENERQGSSQGIRLLNLETLLAGSVDRLWVLGLAEGLFPQKLHEDSLLPDSDRELVSDLAPRGDRVHDQQRHFLAALQLPSQEVTFSYSRQGSKGESLPSRWLLDVVHALSGKQIFAQELDEFLLSQDLLAGEQKPLAGKFVASATADLLEATFSLNEQEFNLRRLLPELNQNSTRQRAKVLADYIADSSPDNDALKPGTEMLRARASNRFTRFDGNLLDEDIADRSEIQACLSAFLSEPLSPSRLQDWVECPYAFFMSSILRVRPLEDFEEADRLSPLVRGEIIHDALEKFFKEEMENTASPLNDPDLAWDDSHKDRLCKTAARFCDSAIDENRFGLSLYHSQEQQAILEDLRMFLDDDSAYRCETRSKPLALEAEFGYSGQPEPVHKLPDGTEIKLRGRIDRIDVRDSPDMPEQHMPTAFVVIDYKTGKHNAGEKNQQYKNLNDLNPHGQGRRLQLPLYASAALDLPAVKKRVPGSAGARVPEAIYWFVTSQSNFFREPIVLSPDALVEIDEALGVVVSGIQHGLFPPGVHKASLAGVACEWCNPDRFGPSKHNVARKLNSALLRPWLELAYPESLPEKAASQKTANPTAAGS